MNLLANSIFLKMALLLFASGFAVILAGLMMRRVRKMLSDGDALPAIPADLTQLPLPTYQAVIQHLKQPEHELSSTRDADSRAKNSSGAIGRELL